MWNANKFQITDLITWFLKSVEHLPSYFSQVQIISRGKSYTCAIFSKEYFTCESKVITCKTLSTFCHHCFHLSLPWPTYVEDDVFTCDCKSLHVEAIWLAVMIRVKIAPLPYCLMFSGYKVHKVFYNEVEYGNTYKNLLPPSIQDIQFIPKSSSNATRWSWSQ